MSVAILGVVAACRDRAVEPREDDANPPDVPSGSEAPRDVAPSFADGGESELVREAGTIAIEAFGDAGRLGWKCSGSQISLLGAAVDPRCAVADRAGRSTRDASAPASGTAAGAARGILQEARREGNAVVFSLVNHGSAVVELPLRFHAGHPELAFSVLAEMADGAVFELAPPLLDVPSAPTVAEDRLSAGAGRGGPPVDPRDRPAPALRVHSALVRLAAGGTARARLVIDPRVARRLDPGCVDPADGGAKVDGGARLGCAPARLPPGRAVLHIGQLVASIDAGPPARVEWMSPASSDPR